MAVCYVLPASILVPSLRPNSFFVQNYHSSGYLFDFFVRAYRPVDFFSAARGSMCSVYSTTRRNPCRSAVLQIDLDGSIATKCSPPDRS